MIFSCVVPFKRKKKKNPDLSLPPCTLKKNVVKNFLPLVMALLQGTKNLFK
jgi:hypothetical protein